LAQPVPANLRCEWRVNPEAVVDPCPELHWGAGPQSAFRVVVAKSSEALRAGQLVWDSGKVGSRLPIVEYAGPQLRDGETYWWRVTVWDRDGEELPPSAPQRFTTRLAPAPHHLPTIRTFINFGGTPEFARDWLDLCFRRDAKRGREDVLVVTYALVCTMVLPHLSTGRPLEGKAKELEDFCVGRGLTKAGVPESMFCHFAEDTHVRLHVGAERANNPIEDRLCPGWDPRNDRNGDGRVDEQELANRVSPKASAREAKDARIPIYYWGPPNDDFVMNVGDPDYQEFMATVHAPRACEGIDGIYFDTVPTDVAGAGKAAAVLEYPRQGAGRNQWLRDLQTLFAEMKTNLPGKLIVANNWDANPMVIDGRQSEEWERLALSAGAWQQALDEALDRDRRGKVQLLQYNPIFDPELSEFGEKLPVSAERDKLYGLATYLLAHGSYTYFGFGRHPYHNVQKLWFGAMKCDLGKPTGDYYVFEEWDAGGKAEGANLLTNSDFEAADANGNPPGWQVLEPVATDTNVRHGGKASVRIDSDAATINNISKQFVDLKPDTTHTLSAWAKTDKVVGDPGAQVYPYEFDGASGVGMLTWTGTGDWKEQRLVFRTGADGTGRLNFRMFGATGTAWFDDLRLVAGAHIAQKVFARRYQKGLVLIRPNAGIGFGDDTAKAIKLPGQFRPLDVNGVPGATTGEASLRNGEAVVLLGTVTGGRF
jgi:hypothetical protein